MNRLEWYAKRWSIEVYHRILKSGCRVEARQLEKAGPREGPVWRRLGCNLHRLCNYLAIDVVVAWRIYHG